MSPFSTKYSLPRPKKGPDLPPNAQNLRFEPADLDFGLGQLGLLRRAPVRIVNPNEFAVPLFAISSRSLDFYFNFPEQRVSWDGNGS